MVSRLADIAHGARPHCAAEHDQVLGNDCYGARFGIGLEEIH